MQFWSQATAGPFRPGALPVSLLAGILVVTLGGLLAGVAGALSAAATGTLVLSYFVVGRFTERIALGMADATGMLITMTSYVVRVASLGFLMWWAMSTPAIAQHLERGWLAAGALAVLIGWLSGLLFAQSRARVPVYDQPYEAPKGWDE